MTLRYATICININDAACDFFFAVAFVMLAIKVVLS